MSLYRIDVLFPPFKSEYKAALKKFRTFRDDLTSTFQVLEKAPEAGDRMKYADSYVFKIRIGVRGSGIGKSGGYRLIYHVDQARLVITPLTLYFKRDRESLTVSELGSRLDKLVKYIEDSPTLIAAASPPESFINVTVAGAHALPVLASSVKSTAAFFPVSNRPLIQLHRRGRVQS